MKTGRARKATPPTPTGLVLSKSGSDLHLAWTTPSGDEPVRARLYNAQSGYVEDIYGVGSDGSVDFALSPTVGQTYFADLRQFLAGEPSAAAESNSLLWS